MPANNSHSLHKLKPELKALLAKYDLTLFEDDGQWCARSDFYDILQFAAYPPKTKSEWTPVTLEEAVK